jgi:valyl-tRNA synthetase
MVNWDPKAKTAISDEEVIHKEQEGKLYYLRYLVRPSNPPKTDDILAEFQPQLSSFSDEKRQKINAVLRQIVENVAAE